MGDKIKTSDINDIALRVSQSKLVEKILIYTPLITGSTLSRYDNVELHYMFVVVSLCIRSPIY